jgi:hypothetical protein
MHIVHHNTCARMYAFIKSIYIYVNPWQRCRVAIALALRTLPLGTHVYAPDCGSWTRVSRGSSLRDQLCALGDVGKEWIRNANLMISRFF